MFKLYVTIIIKPGFCKNRTWLDYYLWVMLNSGITPRILIKKGSLN